MKEKLHILTAIINRCVDRFAYIGNSFFRPIAEEFANIYFGIVKEAKKKTELLRLLEEIVEAQLIAEAKERSFATKEHKLLKLECGENLELDKQVYVH